MLEATAARPALASSHQLLDRNPWVVCSTRRQKATASENAVPLFRKEVVARTLAVCNHAPRSKVIEVLDLRIDIDITAC